MNEIDEVPLPEAISGDYKIGAIVQVSSDDDIIIEDQALSVNSDITLKFINVDSSSDSYKWTIQRGFQLKKTNEATSTNTYQTKFLESGAYDVSANSYDEFSAHKTSASKRFIVGDCTLDDILEIELSSGSLKVEESATFGVKDSDSFSSLNWKITLGSREVASTGSTISVDFSSTDVGAASIEVSAASAEDSECLTYRKAQFGVSSISVPYFNPIVLTDGTNELSLMLENNDIYKYEKPSTDVFLQVQVLHADTCQHQVNQNDQTAFNCNGESIPVVSSSDTGCIETQISISASNSESEFSQIYYNYCGANDDYCYFSPIKKKQSHHICRAIATVKVSDKSDLEIDPKTVVSTTTTTQNSCSSGQYNTQAACDNANPSNSTCTQQSNSCYAWSCDDGYQQNSDGNACVLRVGPDCGSARNTCDPGTPDDNAVNDSPTHYKWRCTHNGQSTDNCQVRKPGPSTTLPPEAKPPKCDTRFKKRECEVGIYVPNSVEEKQNEWIWECQSGNQTVSCSKRRTCYYNVPASTYKYRCKFGASVIESSKNETIHYWEWKCLYQDPITGQNQRSGQCFIPKPPECGTGEKDIPWSCDRGTVFAGSKTETNTHWEWKCQFGNVEAPDPVWKYTYSQEQAVDCQKAKP